MEIISWTHPRRRITETLCPRHEAEVLRALTTLGLGCTGTAAPDGAECMRCVVEASGLEPRFVYGMVG